MKIAACAFPIIVDLELATQTMFSYIDQAAEAKCDMIVFPEAALGGLDISGVISIDSLMGLKIDALSISCIKERAAHNGIAIGLGFLELSEDQIWDSYLIFDQRGETALHYRRYTDGWLPRVGAPDYYGCGKVSGVTQSGFGKLGVLLCGDLFHEDLVRLMADQSVDLCLHPMARAFPYSINTQRHWDSEEFPFYLEQYAKLKTNVIVCNSVDIERQDLTPYCGGAWFIGKGRVISSLPLMQEGLLIYDGF